jgi:peroxiredoxin
VHPVIFKSNEYHTKSEEMKKSVIAAFLMIVMVSAAGAQDYAGLGMDVQNGPVPVGLKPGDKAPAFSGYDQTGARIQSAQLLENGPIVLFFYRGKWDPVCSKYLNNYQDSVNILTDMGVKLVAITPESIENVEQTVRLHNLTFTVIYDCQEQIMKDYDVFFRVTGDYCEMVRKKFSIDIARNNERDEAHLPVTAAYVINRQGIIVAVWFDPDPGNRASVNWMIRNLAAAL